MLYLERQPAPPLSSFILTLWYARAPQVAHHRERVLPTGRVQVILNLARDYFVDCPENQSNGQPHDESNDQPSAQSETRSEPALIVGARSVYEIISTSDMADLIGIVFAPGGFSAFARDAADRFSNRTIPLEALWGRAANELRDLLRESPDPHRRLRCFEQFLLNRYRTALIDRNPMVEFALNRFERAPGVATVRSVADSTGWSERRFSEVFREEVGFGPKAWCRIRRFQRTVQQLHAGVDVPWSRLALDLGYYDQSHFANEFRAFSGIDATTYSSQRALPWANHVPIV